MPPDDGGEKDEAMQETNTAILDHVEDAGQAAADKKAAEREKALMTYWSILADPQRTSAGDKAAFAAAMTMLGKTIAQADIDASVLESMRLMPEVLENSKKAARALFAAECGLREWQEKVPGELQKVHQVTRDKIVAVQQLTRERAAATASFRDKFEFLSQHNQIAEEAQRAMNLPDWMAKPNSYPADHAARSA
jgi:hypothetical protein